MKPLNDELFSPIPELFDFENFTPKLESLIESEVHFVPGSLVISLNAPFGGGKNTFLNLWADRLNKNASAGLFHPGVIRINAWEDDHAEDPLASLVFSLSQALAENQDESPLLDAAKDVFWYASAIGAQIAEKFTGINPNEAGRHAEEKKEARAGGSNAGHCVFEAYRSRRDAMTKFKGQVRRVIDGRKLPTIVLVDELDRCRPSYTISYLEAIKHVFDVRGLVFVLAVDRGQLQAIAEAEFGSGIDCGEYIRKFVQRGVSLPRDDERGRGIFLKQLVERYLDTPGFRRNVEGSFGDLPEYVGQVMEGCRLEPRQMLEVFRICGYLVSDRLERGRGNARRGRPWLWRNVFLLAALRVCGHQLYSSLGTETATSDEVWRFVSESWSAMEHRIWWSNLFWASGAVLDRKNLDYQGFYNYLNEIADTSEEIEGIYYNQYKKFKLGFNNPLTGNSTVGFGDLYAAIEGLDAW